MPGQIPAWYTEVETVRASPLPEIDRAVSEVERLVGVGGSAFVVVQGEPTAGKSTVLSRLARKARATGGRPVIELKVRRGVEGPAERARYGFSDDSGAVLLALAAAQLGPHAPEPLRMLDDQRPWAAVRSKLREELQRTKALIVVDDAVATPFEPTFSSYFVERTRDALDALLGSDVPRVVTTSQPHAFAAAQIVSVRATSRAGEMLDPSQWNGLGASAARLASEADAVALDALSPLELRLAVALVFLGENPVQLTAMSSRELVHRLFELLGTEGARARDVLAKLSLERTSLDDSLLRAVGYEDLDPATRTLLRHGVLYEEEGRLHLHETFAREATALGWLAEASLCSAHAALGAHHLAAFSQASAAQRTESALEHELEAFHHLGQAGDLEGACKIRVLFTEQLDALGKALSLAKKHDDAATVYTRAIDRDPNDWYAHHYLAFNLDVRGRDASRVEDEYRKALALYPQHVWHHGRLATFYVTRGRLRDADATWHRASKLLERTHGDDERLYLELHRPLIRLLLHRGQLDLARRVLDAVPRRFRVEGDVAWRALERLHAQLDEAERDEAVFPSLDVEAAQRWATPHLVPTDARSSVREWMPGRVTHVDESGVVTLRVAPRPGHYGWLDLSRDEVEREWRGTRQALGAGTFVEVIQWADRREILVHPTARIDRDLPRVLPPPDRYLRAPVD